MELFASLFQKSLVFLNNNKQRLCQGLWLIY